jgi:predicted TIM-barrel fold metal-dependent hydrolase
MKTPFIIDAHVHTGFPSVFFSPEVDAEQLLKRMDQFGIAYAINLSSMRAVAGFREELITARKEFELSNGRILYLGFFNPKDGNSDLLLLKEACSWTGFKGIKIHPSFNGIPADDPLYEPVWGFAAENDLTIVAHSWSVSTYNPVQVFSTPEKFEIYVKKYPAVRFVLAHSGGRGTGRHEAVRMANTYTHVYTDCAGDIYDYHYFEDMIRSLPENKLLFGSDYPWFDLRSHLTRMFLSDITDSQKQRILRDNAIEAFKLEDL